MFRAYDPGLRTARSKQNAFPFIVCLDPSRSQNRAMALRLLPATAFASEWKQFLL